MKPEPWYVSIIFAGKEMVMLQSSLPSTRVHQLVWFTVDVEAGRLLNELSGSPCRENIHLVTLCVISEECEVQREEESFKVHTTGICQHGTGTHVLFKILSFFYIVYFPESLFCTLSLLKYKIVLLSHH